MLALARLILPTPAADALTLAAELPEAVDAARVALDAGHGPLVALRAFAASTDGALDDAAVAEIERWLTRAVDGLDVVCAAGVWVSEREPQIRSAVDAALAGVFGVAYYAAAWRERIRAWG